MNTKLKLGEKIDYNQHDDRTITGYAKRLINEVLESEGILYPTAKQITDNESSLLLTKNGKYAKRLKKLVKKVLDIKLSNDAVSEIGNIANNYSQSMYVYPLCFVITDVFDWNAGEFGDWDSCYWTHHSSARDTLEDDCNSYALRAYSTETGYGRGRAWMHELENYTVIFNGYGVLKTVEFAMVYADITGLDYKKVSVENQGAKCGFLWINNGTGYIVGKLEDIESVDSVDLGLWEVCGYYSENQWYAHCYECGVGMREDDTIFANDDTANCYCERCYDANFTQCDGCYDYKCNEDISECDGQDYCADCYMENVSVCESCIDDVHNDNMEYIDQEGYCEDCYKNLTTCEDCDDILTENKTHYTDDNHTLCGHCIHDNFTCNHCGVVLFERTYCACLQIPMPI